MEFLCDQWVKSIFYSKFKQIRINFNFCHKNRNLDSLDSELEDYHHLLNESDTDVQLVNLAQSLNNDKTSTLNSVKLNWNKLCELA